MSLKQHKCQRELSHMITLPQINKLQYILYGCVYIKCIQYASIYKQQMNIYLKC